MGLSVEFVDDHINRWENQLSQSRYPWTSHWPSRIFRHDPLENISEILESGLLLSRNDSTDLRPLDIAGQQVINSTTQPHEFVRLYFRPRTPTQYLIEGIRKQAECYQGSVSCLIGLMIFESRTILCRDDVQFSDMNMQSPMVSTGSTEQFFSEQINFENVYHHGWKGSDDNVRKQRCAEVLVNSPLSVNNCLQYIYCRTNAERETLISFLSTETQKRWKDKILVSTDMKLFEREYSFVEDAYITPNGLVVNLSPRKDNANIDLEVIISDSLTDETKVHFRNQNFQPLPPSGKKGWIFTFPTDNGTYRVQVKIEGSIAYKNELTFTELPF